MAARRVLRSLDEVLRKTAAEKRAAAQARRRGARAGAENPAQVYADACSEVAASFRDLGFRYAKSGPHMSKQANGFTFRVSFQSSHHNIPGQHVALLAAVGVRSSALKKWRLQRAHPLRSDGHVAGGLIGNLIEDHPYIEWELADDGVRPAVVADIEAAVREIALPYFGHFADPAALAVWLAEHELPEMRIGDAVEFALCFGSHEAGASVGARYLRRHSDWASEYADVLRNFNTAGLPHYFPTRHVEQLAWVAVAHGLNLV